MGVEVFGKLAVRDPMKAVRLFVAHEKNLVGRFFWVEGEGSSGEDGREVEGGEEVVEVGAVVVKAVVDVEEDGEEVVAAAAAADVEVKSNVAARMKAF